MQSSNVKLNPSQIKAVKHTSGPLLIIAGAGTGKTTVISKRIRYLISKKNKPEQILALTFTEKAASEMLERLDVIMPFGYEEPWISTFHSFCDRILREEGLEIGLSTDYKILDQTNQWILFKKNLFNFDFKYYLPLGNPTKFIGAMLKFFSRCQDEDINPEELIRYVESSNKRKATLRTQKSTEDTENPKNSQRSQLTQHFSVAKKLSDKKFDRGEIDRLLELAKAYEKYQEIKLKENFLDFGDLITWTLKLFKKRSAILKKYRQQFKHILVDEFQDTNFAQLQLIKLLAPSKKNPNLVVVGDDFQSIYKWRGAAVSNILDFKKHYPKAKEIILNRNYRSTQPLLDHTYHLIKNNEPETLEVKLKIDKSLQAQKKEKITPVIYQLPTLEEEADFVVEKILDLIAKGNYTYKDFAILARANNHLESFTAALKRSGLPYQLVGNRGLFDQEEVKNIIYFAKAVVDPRESINLFQLMQAEVFALEAKDLLAILAQARAVRKTLWEVVQKKAEKNKALAFFVEQIKKSQEEVPKNPTTKVLFNFIQGSGFIKKFLQEESLENQLKLKNLNLFFQKIKSFESENKENGLVEFVDWLETLLEAGENPGQAEIEDIDTISLLTVHRAKGLEFGIVFVVNCVNDRFPTRRRSDPIEFPEELIKESLSKGDSHLQEERRLFYVACTRARDYLFLTCGLNYGGAREKKPSLFLKELGLPIKKPKLNSQQLSWFSQPKAIIVPKPRKVIDGRLTLPYISFSQIDTFLTCPLKYKYRYILQVPTKSHHALTFGQTIHLTLRDFHLFEKKGQKADLKTLLYLYKQHFNESGYESEKHKKQRFEKGKKTLKHYFKVHKQNFPGHPIFLEKSFRLKIGEVPLFGKIDRIDRIGSSFELIDYKTGSLKDQKRVDKDRQLTVYAMASFWALGIRPEKLSLYFIEENKKLSTQRSKEDLKREKEYLEQTIEKIKKSKFPAKAGYPFPCQYCEYNLICPFVKKK